MSARGSITLSTSWNSEGVGVPPMLPPSLVGLEPAEEDEREEADVTVHAVEGAVWYEPEGVLAT